MARSPHLVCVMLPLQTWTPFTANCVLTRTKVCLPITLQGRLHGVGLFPWGSFFACAAALAAAP